MSILDKQFESLKGSDKSLFFCPNSENLNARNKLTNFVDSERLCKSVIDIASYLSQNSLSPILKVIEERCLEERLQELKLDIENTKLLELEFSNKMTTYTSNYNKLLAKYEIKSESIETHKVIIPGEQICAVTTLLGKESESTYRPRIVLNVLTGLEAPVLLMKDNQVVEEAGRARWYDFPLEQSTFKVLGLPLSDQPLN